MTEDPPAVVIESNLNGKGLLIDMNAPNPTDGFTGAYVKQNGKGIGAQVEMSNTGSTSAGMIIETITSGGPGLNITMNDPMGGSNSNTSPGIDVIHKGLGSAARFVVDESSNTSQGISVDHMYGGSAAKFKSGAGSEPAVDVETASSRGLNIISTSTSSDLSVPVGKIESSSRGHVLELVANYSDPSVFETPAEPLRVEGNAGYVAHFENTNIAGAAFGAVWSGAVRADQAGLAHRDGTRVGARTA